MIITLKEIRNITCVELEQRLGLKRGDIASMTTNPDGSVEIATPLKVTDAQKQAIADKLGLTIV